MRRLTGPVEIVGTGLLGTSIGLALRRAGVEVLLSDRSPEHVRTASGLGAGRARTPEDRPQLVVVAVPPDDLGAVIATALEATDDAVVTDVGSVKSAPLAAVVDLPGAERYVGSHPMAGSAQSGPLGASATLFDGRPWAVTPHPAATVESVELVEALVAACGATKVLLTPAEHDRAVARTSHVPHLLATLVAARLAEAPENHLVLSGQGVRDVTRVAGGDPALYSQIVSGNADAVLALLGEVRSQLDEVIAAVGAGDRAGLHAVLERGVAGTRAIPGKHGGPVRPMRSVLGLGARRARRAGPAVRRRRWPARSTSRTCASTTTRAATVGLVEIVVDAERADHLLGSLESRGWVTHR